MMKSFSFAIFVAASIGFISSASAATFVVNGTDNPFLAGQFGASCCSGDTSATDAPIGAFVTSGTTFITFTNVSGEVSNEITQEGGAYPLTGPNGNASDPTEAGTTNGIAGYNNAPLDALVGVFVKVGTAPSSSASETDLSVANTTPALDQIFFIGDGTLGGSSPAEFSVPTVPVGTEVALYLGTVDGFQWNNNDGAFTVTATGLAPVPEPATWAFLFAGFAMIGYALRRRKESLATA